MNKVATWIVVIVLTICASKSFAIPRPPEYVKISITQNQNSTGFQGLIVDFKWLGDAPEFSSNQAVEFEIIILTDKPKCFGQPPGGKDNNPSHARSNLPDNYTDVWNYYWPSDDYEIITELRSNCGPISGWCKSGIEVFSRDMSDEHANFAVGSRQPDLIQANELYSFVYPLELPDDPDCHEYDNGLGWVQMNMTVIPNTCTSVCGSKRNCPHLLGAPNCDEYKIFREEVPEGEECLSIIKRLCAPVIEYTFSPYDIGFSDIACGDGEEGGGACIDDDQDGFFALFQNSSGNWIPMFGSHTGDCEDDPTNPNAGNIDNTNYDPETGICTTLIDPPVDPCSTTTSGNGYYCGDNSELLDYNGNPDDLVLCQNGSTVSVQSCSLGCVLMPSGQNDECEQPCTIICSQGQTRCSGNDVEVCSADQCSFVYDHTCGSNQSCTNGTCLTPTNPPPEITSVSCTSYIRGDSAICTIYGNNLDAGPGSSTFIAEFYNSQIASWSSSHIDVSGYWPCIEPLGYKQVSHRNPDYQRDDTYNLVEVLMGDLEITHAWPGVVEEGASNIPIGANGCNFGQQVVLFIDGVAITNTHLQAPDQVLGEGQVTWPAGSPPSRFCVAKYPGASIGPDKECLPDYVTIIAP